MNSSGSKICALLFLGIWFALPGMVCGQEISIDSLMKSLEHQAPESDYFKGVARPHRLVELAAKTEGLIKELSVVEGQFVMKNQLLATIEDDVPKARLKMAEIEARQTGEVDRAELEWKIESERFNRLESIVSQNATSELELWEKAAVRDQKKAIWQEAIEKQALSKARLQLSIAEWNRHRIFAPFDGYVIEIHKKAGTQPKSDEKILTVADLTHLEVELHLPLRHFGQFKQGSELTLIAEQPVGKEIKATVSSVSPLVNATSGTFRCRLMIDNADQKLPAGFLVSAKLE